MPLIADINFFATSGRHDINNFIGIGWKTGFFHLITNPDLCFQRGGYDFTDNWFIKLFTKELDTVLDPFMGSGTTIFVANRMRRHSIGIEIMPEYYEMVNEQINPVELYLLEPKVKYEKAKPQRSYAVR